MKKYNILVTTAAVFLFSQASYAKLGDLPTLPTDEVNSRLAQYEYDVTYSVKEVSRKIIKDGIEKTDILLSYKDRLGKRDRTISVDLYVRKNLAPGRVPTILVFPPLAGLSVTDTTFAKYFAREGYMAVISHVTRDVLDFTDLPSLFAEFTDTVVDNRILIDYLSTLNQVDSNKIGVFGASLGGIRAGFFRGLESRVKATFMIVGGGNVPGIMALSQQKDVLALRNRFMKMYDYKTADEYEAALRVGMNWDPIWSGHQRSGDSVYMVIGGTDDKVHTEYQEELFKSINGAERKRVNLGHTETSLYVTMNKAMVGDFFKAALK